MLWVLIDVSVYTCLGYSWIPSLIKHTTPLQFSRPNTEPLLDDEASIEVRVV